MIRQTLPYAIDDLTAQGFLVHDPSFVGPRPGVVIFHAWKGQSDFERTFAEGLAKEGYAVLAADLYGNGTLATDSDGARALMTPLASNRLKLRRRLNASIDALKAQVCVDENRVAVLGFCFGGMCAIETARSGANVRGAVSLHGLLGMGDGPTADTITAKLLILHGFDDPMAPPDHVLALSEALTQAKADWQLHMYGGVVHAFTNPAASAPSFGTVYDPSADRRARQSTAAFLREVLS